jgi:hypothetical protein
MLPSEKLELLSDIQQTMKDLNEAIGMVKDEAALQGISPQRLQLPDGSYILHPLLIAKASALNAYVALKKE